MGVRKGRGRIEAGRGGRNYNVHVLTCRLGGRAAYTLTLQVPDAGGTSRPVLTLKNVLPKALEGSLPW